MKKIFLLSPTILSLFFSVFTCSFLSSCETKKKPEAPSSQIILGFSQIGNESSWRMSNSASIKKAAEEENIQLIYEEAQQKQENQIKALRRFIVCHVDVIAFVPIVEEGWDSVLKEAKQAGIPVIVVDRKIKTEEKDLYKCYVGQDGMEEGRKAARFLLEKYKDQKGPFNIIELYGTERSSPARERDAGFREVLKDDRRFRIVYQESGDFLRSRGKEIISQIIKFNGSLSVGKDKIDIIFSQNDAMTLGAIDSLEANGIKPGTDVTIVSVDGEQKAINALSQGKINCIIECNPKSGPELMKLVKDAAQGKELPKTTFIDETVFTENDNLILIPPRGY